MTQIVYALIDNHTTRKHTNYNFLFKTKNFKEYLKYIEEKGLN